jgi:hypothetical protein
MKVSIRELAEVPADVVAGSLRGRRVFARLLEITGEEPNRAEPIFLDFRGVSVATASFLREAVLAFRNAVRRRRSNFYPVVANASELVTDELRMMLEQQGDVLMACSLDDEDRPNEPRLIGVLEPKQRITFDLVNEFGETDAAELMREYGKNEKREIGQTAWNNRLAALAGLGLVIESSQGRAKRYRPLFME